MTPWQVAALRGFIASRANREIRGFSLHSTSLRGNTLSKRLRPGTEETVDNSLVPPLFSGRSDQSVSNHSYETAFQRCPICISHALALAGCYRTAGGER